MFDIEKTLSEYGLTTETYEELLKDCSDKVGKISDKDWDEILVDYNIDWNPDTARKSQQPPLLGGAFIKQYYDEKYTKGTVIDEDKYLEKLRLAKDKAYKEAVKLRDQRREYNKLLTVDARSEHLFEEMIQAANKLDRELPLKSNDKFINVNTKKEALLCLSDWHYGMITDNIWNVYNTDICKQRVRKLIDYTKEYLKLNQIDMLHIIMLGDSAYGGIHSGCRVKSEEDVCDQVMHVAEIMAEMFDELSNDLNHITVYSCYGNHLRTIQNKNDSIESDNMEKIIPWWWSQRLKNNDKIDIQYSSYKEFTKLSIMGYNICCVHGNLDNFKNIGTTVNTIFSRKFCETIDYTISGDKHHLEEFEQFDIESILVRSLCGTDDYANDHRLYSKAGQTLMIFNNKYGRESTYNIVLN